MNSLLQEISMLVEDFGSAPRLEEMPQRTLADKGIAGPTAAHVIEEVHTPLNSGLSNVYHWYLGVSEYRRRYLCGAAGPHQSFLQDFGASRAETRR